MLLGLKQVWASGVILCLIGVGSGPAYGSKRELGAG